MVPNWTGAASLGCASFSLTIAFRLPSLGQSFEGMRPFAHVTSSPRDESLLLVFVVSTDRVKLRAFLRLVTIDQLMDVPITATSWKGSKVDQNLVKFGHIWKLYDMGAGWDLTTAPRWLLDPNTSILFPRWIRGRFPYGTCRFTIAGERT